MGRRGRDPDGAVSGAEHRRRDATSEASLEGDSDAIHERIVRADSHAAEDACAALHPQVLRRVRRRVCGAELQDLITAADDALMIYLREPERFDPQRGSLVNWLVTIAERRLRNSRRQGRRRSRHEVPVGIDLTRLSTAATVLSEHVDWAEGSSREKTDAILAWARGAKERDFLRVRLAGASVPEQANVLGFGDDTLAEQRRAVSRVLERILKRARRIIERARMSQHHVVASEISIGRCIEDRGDRHVQRRRSYRSGRSNSTR